MARAMTRHDRVPYVLEDERDLSAEEQTIFYVRTMTGAENYRSMSRATLGLTVSGLAAGGAERTLYAIHACLIGWENFLDVDGKPMEFPGAVEAVKLMTPSDIGEIGVFIVEGCELSAEDVGNSDGPSPSPGAGPESAEPAKPTTPAQPDVSDPPAPPSDRPTEPSASDT